MLTNSEISTNLDEVQKRIWDAAAKAGRNPEDITLIAVSKTKPLEMLQSAYEHGQRIFGENKVQEICEKHPNMPDDTVFHMIGHLQTNKVKQLGTKAALIHSVDSLHLAEEIDKNATKNGYVQNILIEVNVACEDTKFGVTVDECEVLVREISKLKSVKIKGLMTIAPFVENPEENREFFAKLRQLSVDLKNKNIDNIDMDILSMGMTNDYEVAVEEGATLVRVGTGIFGTRIYS